MNIIDEMEKTYFTPEIQNFKAPNEVRARVKDRLEKDILRLDLRRTVIFKVAAAAAMILLPLLIYTTAMWHKAETFGVSDETTVWTAKGEKVRIMLPDGTEVYLNSNSRLNYFSGQFMKLSRTVSFEGEAYFSVAKDEHLPFIIMGDKFDVRVLGTKFNMKSRPDSEYAELTLEEGTVEFTSHATCKTYIVKANQMVRMKYSTGEVAVFDLAETRIAPWKDNEMLYRGIKLSEVLTDIADSYNFHITYDGNVDTNMLFTGTLFTDDLNGSLSILEKTCKLRISLKNGNIMVRRQI